MLNNITLLIKYVGRGMFGKCPNCSRKKLFLSHFKMKKACNNCGIDFIENNGDNWFFLLIVDRALFIFPIVVAFYFEIHPKMIISLSLFLLILFIIITPFRLGLCLGFDYYFRSKIIKK